MKKVFFLSLSLFCLTTLFAQTNFKPGFIVDKNKDTIRGVIDFRAWDNNPVSIVFKAGATVNSYSVRDILGFGVDNEGNYKTAAVSYQLSDLDGFKTGPFYNEEIRTDTVFLRTLVSGKYRLYELVTKQRPYYFLEASGDGVKELVGRARIGEYNQIVEDPMFKNQLLSYAVRENKRDQLFLRINRTNYRSDELIKVVAELNGSGNIDYTAADKKRKVNSLEIGAGAIGSFYSVNSSVPPSGAVRLISVASFESAVSPLVSLGVTLGSKREFNHIQMGVQFEYMTLTANGSGERSTGAELKEVYSIDMKVLRTSVQLRYIFNPLQPVKFYVLPYVGLGNVLGNRLGTTVRTFSTGAQNTDRDYPRFNFSHVYYGAGVGLLLNRNKIELKANVASGIYTDPNASVELNAVQVGLTYSYTFLKF